MMQYKGYIGKVEYDAEKHSLHGEVGRDPLCGHVSWKVCR